MSASLHDLRGVARGARKRFVRRLGQPDAAREHGAFLSAVVRWHQATLAGGQYWRWVVPDTLCDTCDQEADRACLTCEATEHWYGRDHGTPKEGW